MTVADDLTGWTSQAVLAAARELRVPNGALQARTEEHHLWGVATVPRLRGRGACSALLHRMAVAREHGATLALVQGRVETSAPILLRAGFSDYGRQRLVRVAL